MEDTIRVYNLYGLRVCSEIALPAPLAPDGFPPFDLRIGWGERKAIADDAPAGNILARLLLDDGRGYTLVDMGSGYIYRFHHTAECWIDQDLRSVRLHLAPHIAPELATLLAVGNVMACVLSLRGELALHASAVEVGGVALAFLGASGMGKSSLAALLCAAGARLITDDLLRLQRDGQSWRCYAGTGELRLRKSAAAIIGKFPVARLSPTADDRIAVKMEALGSMPALKAILIPHLSSDCGTLKVERIPQAQSLLYLMAYPRLNETSRGARLQERLDFLGRIAAEVPVFKVEVPWGVPLSKDGLSSILSVLWGRQANPCPH